MLLADTHFGHRESAGIVVDLFWSHGEPGDRFRVEVQDTRAGDRFVSTRRRGRRRSTLPPPARIGARSQNPPA
jgi:hypothetical protein